MKRGSHYVYTLSYPETMGGAIFYIGKGSNGRIDEHEGEARRGEIYNPYKINVIKKIWSAGEEIVKTKVAHFATDKEAKQYEVELIARTPNLTNLTRGGEGVSGLVHSEEARRKMSETKKGKPRRPYTEEERRKMSEARKGKPGKPHSEETRRKMSNTRKGKIHSDEWRRNMSKSLRGRTIRPHTEEELRKMSEFQKTRPRKPHSEETCRKMSEARKGKPGHPHTEETRRRISASHKARWKNVASTVSDPEDALIVEGFPQIDAKTGAISVFASNVTSKKLQAAKRQG